MTRCLRQFAIAVAALLVLAVNAVHAQPLSKIVFSTDVIVVTIELIYGIRFGDDIPWIFVLGNFGLAAAGNMVGGIGLVTLNRLTQGRQASSGS